MRKEIFDYVSPLMTTRYPELTDKIFWANTRLKEPQKPYLMMTAINDDEIHRTSEIDGVVTEYRSATVTFRICMDSEVFTNDADCQRMIDYLRLNLSSESAVDYFQSNQMSNRWESISSTRDLTRPVDGGYIYIREFDIPFEYMLNLEQDIDVSKGVKADVSVDGEVDIDFYIDRPEQNE